MIKLKNIMQWRVGENARPLNVNRVFTETGMYLNWLHLQVKFERKTIKMLRYRRVAQWFLKAWNWNGISAHLSGAPAHGSRRGARDEPLEIAQFVRLYNLYDCF